MKTRFGILTVVFLSFWMVRPLWGKTYFPMHDDTQVARVVVMGKALKQGQFPVRWVSDLGYGYGYPIFNFYGPLPYYVGGSLYALGMDNVQATKVMFGLGGILAGVFCFLLLESVFGFLGGVVGSVLFAYTPYHAVDMFIRGAVGEYWAIAFLPLVLWGALLTCQKKKNMGIVIGSLGLVGVILSHTILGYLTLMFILLGFIVYSFASLRTKANSLAFGLMILIGLGISAFFWLPAFVEMGATGVSTMITDASTGFFDHFVCIRQFWNSPWGYGGSAAECFNDGMSFKLGKLQLGLTVLGLILFKSSPIMIIGFLLFLFSLAGMLDISKPVWSAIPLVSFIQYPWRLLSFSILSMGIFGGFVITVIRNPFARFISAVVIISACIAINAKLFQPQYLYTRDSKAFETPEDIRFRVSRISDEYLPVGILKPKTPDEIVKILVEPTNTLRVSVLQDSDTYFRAELQSADRQSVLINKAVFPGWQYQINGQPVTPSISLGLPTVVVSEGTSILELRFTNTPIRILGNIISIISLMMLGIVVYYGTKNYT